MRKLLVLTAAAALVVSSSGCCGCFGKVRSWFHKGSPCSSRVAPAVLGAPLTMSGPAAPMMMAPPMQCVESAPMCMPCPPCSDPCGDPCGDYSTGYYGGYVSEGGSTGCAACEAGGGQVIVDESSYIPAGAIPTMPEGSVGGSDSPRYSDPRPVQ